MVNHELLLYGVHGLYWTSFGVAGMLLKAPPGNASDVVPTVSTTTTARTLARYSPSISSPSA